MARVNRSISPSQAFSLRDYERLNQASAALKGRVVCLTAGSGTSFQSSVTDKASGKPLTERLVASDVMRRVESILSGLGADVSVVDEGPNKATDNRVRLIRQSSPSLSISINCDWLDQPLANGVSAFYLGKAETGEIRSPIGHRAAELILKEVLARTTATDLGIHGRSWDILRLTSIPSIQLDIGYLSAIRKKRDD
jgi:N-acetylmuramoyl-L-alanine amidase